MPSPRLVLRCCVVDPDPRTATFRDGRVERLTPRELELLLYLAARPDQVIGRDELLERVWGYGPSVVSRAVDTNIRRLREKVEGDPQQPDHVFTAFGEGYRFVPVAADAPEPAPAPDVDDEAFVGREAELSRIRGWLAVAGPGVLLVGPPGAGKTRLALRVGALLAPVLVGGTHVVDVTEARDLPQVAHAVALALGLESPQVAAATLARSGHVLRALGPTLVVLDNCEGAPAAVGEVARALVEAAPELRVLATSREPIAHQDPDRVLTVEPLPLADAVRLFEVYARRVRPDFVVGTEQQAVVEALVEKLERIPLAIALAAGRAGAMSPRALLDRLDDRFRLLQSRDRDNPRQRTLRAALDGSWELLSAEERDTLTACSAFRGGFDPAAASRVVGRPDTDDLLASLVKRSLLERRHDRFGGYAFVREYATARLAEEPAREREVHERHGDCFRDRALAAGRAQERGRRLSRDRSNLAEATTRAVGHGRLEVAVTCAIAALDVIGREGPYELGVTLVQDVLALDGIGARDSAVLRLRLAVLEQATGVSDGAEALDAAMRDAERSGDEGLLADAMRSRASRFRNRGQSAQAVAELEAALPLARRADGASLHNVLTSLASALREVGRTEEAYTIWLELEVLTRDMEPDNLRAHVLGNLSLAERRFGRLVEAEVHGREAVVHATGLGDRRSEALARMSLGNLMLEVGRLDAARSEYLVCLRLAREVGELDTVARVHGNLAIIERLTGNAEAASEHLRIAMTEFERIGEPRQVAVARGNLGEISLLRGETEEGLVQLEEAAAWMRQAGDGPSEAEFLISMVAPLLHLERAREARATADRAEGLVRGARNTLLLVGALARRGLVELAEGRDARPTLAEIAGLGVACGESSEAGRAVGELREALARRG